jgi:hypothetical protein
LDVLIDRTVPPGADPETLQACDALCPLIGAGHGKRRETHPMTHGDLLEVWLCMMPTRLLLDL